MVVEIYNDVQTSKVMLESLPFDEHIKKACFYSKYMKLLVHNGIISARHSAAPLKTSLVGRRGTPNHG